MVKFKKIDENLLALQDATLDNGPHPSAPRGLLCRCPGHRIYMPHAPAPFPGPVQHSVGTKYQYGTYSIRIPQADTRLVV